LQFFVYTGQDTGSLGLLVFCFSQPRRAWKQSLKQPL